MSSDKLEQHYGQQLSALMDGELPPDQARFLLRRIGHDAELAGRWARWHLVGDVLRGQPVAALPAGAEGFPARVSAALAGGSRATVPGSRPRWRYGIGAALAASVAALALFVTRPPLPAGDVPALVVTGEATPASTPAGPPPVAVEPPVREVSVPQFAAVPPAVAPAPGSASMRARPPAPPRRAVASVGPTDPAPSMPVPGAPSTDAPAPTAVLASADARPFASPREPQARPWPRAVLPGLSGEAGGLVVGFDDAAQAPSFYPFEPRLPVDTERTP